MVLIAKITQFSTHVEMSKHLIYINNDHVMVYIATDTKREPRSVSVIPAAVGGTIGVVVVSVVVVSVVAFIQRGKRRRKPNVELRNNDTGKNGKALLFF